LWKFVSGSTLSKKVCKKWQFKNVDRQQWHSVDQRVVQWVSSVGTNPSAWNSSRSHWTSQSLSPSRAPASSPDRSQRHIRRRGSIALPAHTADNHLLAIVTATWQSQQQQRQTDSQGFLAEINYAPYDIVYVAAQAVDTNEDKHLKTKRLNTHNIKSENGSFTSYNKCWYQNEL